MGSTEHPTEPHEDRATVKFASREESNFLDGWKKKLYAIAEELGVKPHQFEIVGFQRQGPDGRVDLMIRPKPEIEEIFNKRFNVKIFGKDTITIGGVELYRDPAKEPDGANRTPIQAFKRWSSSEHERRSKPRDDTQNLPDL
jgi:hypothetical protein